MSRDRIAICGFVKAVQRRLDALIRARTTFTEFSLPTAGATPIGITLGGDGNLWFAQKKANKIGRITPGGEFSEFAVPTENAGPDGIALGPDGNVWFSETDVGQIGRITPDGKSPSSRPAFPPAASRCRS